MNFLCRQLRKAGLLLAIVAICSFAYGQIPVKGKVISSEDNQGIPGVSILIKGTSQGVITGSDGSYNISVRKAEDILVYRFIGYKAQEIKVGTSTTINVSMELEFIDLESVVVMGYSTKRKNEITSAVSTSVIR